ncbi:hypothetical protein B566_EDAN009357 [Ephemera danica]|nr:hypothetical protein B566_EDAN009357 [Ephemera danica]
MLVATGQSASQKLKKVKGTEWLKTKNSNMSVKVTSWTCDLWEKHIELFSRDLKCESVWNQIPSLNGKSTCDFTDGQFVKFRGMIQDMHNPEFYMQEYELDEEIKISSTKNSNAERQSLYCISVPAVNDWASETTKGTLSTATVLTSEEDRGKKRGAEEMMAEASEDMESGERSSTQKLRNESDGAQSENAKPTPVYNLNFPLPGTDGQACILKVYDMGEKLLLNEVVEVAGFLSLDPNLSCVSASEDENSAKEYSTLYPPPSLIPRLHVVATRHLDHYLEQILQTTAKDAFHDLQIVLNPILLGDQLATDYLICHLVSRVFLRKDVTTLGQFSINFYNIPLGINYVEKFNLILQLLLPKTYHFPMTLDNLNTISFVPKKDYEREQLKSGLLQLSEGTHLILDETKLSTGRLGDLGTRNMLALQTLISKQKLDYDFQFYQVEFATDIPVLIFSEKKSILQNQEIIEQSFIGANLFLKNGEIVNRIRTFLCAARLAEYSIPESLQLVVQNDFVNMRQRNPNFKADDLHSLLVLARLVTLSRGKQVLTEDLWHTACVLEETRRQRLNSS